MAPNQVKRQNSRRIVENGFKRREETWEAFMYDPDWWKKTIIYHIYVRSFCDGNGDGFGDLPGIISKLDYFTYLNIGCIYLSPIHPSPMRDCGYDITDFKAIDPLFGTLDDFDRLVEGLHRRGIKLIFDFIPNHTSIDHPWFQESCKSREGPYADYYVWCDGYQDEKGGHWPPNNWLAPMSGSMWEWCETRQQYYLHQFMPEMPDLNFRNPKILEEMDNILEFWLDRGVDGFRVDAIKHLFESENFYQDEESAWRHDLPSYHYDTIRHRYSIDLPEVHDVVRRWRSLLDRYYEKTGLYRCMIQEIYEDWGTTVDDIMQHYTNGSDGPFNFRLVSRFKRHSGGWALRHMIEDWLYHMPPGKWPIWAIGNHDYPRIADKFGPEFVDAVNALHLLLPGTPTTYYGEELGMRGKRLSFDETKDHYSRRFGPDLYHQFTRDPCRGPMLWDCSENAGFCPPGVKPWLPTHEEYVGTNVEVQQFSKESTSLKFYRELAILRQEPEFVNGTYQAGYTNQNLFTIMRRRSPEDAETDIGYRYDVVINVGYDAECFNTPANYLFWYDGNNFPDVQNGPEKPRIVLHTNNLRPEQPDAIAGFPFAPLNFYPGQAFVIKSRPKKFN